MRNISIIIIFFVFLYSLFTPIISPASTTKAKARHKAVVACKDKNEGDYVEFVNKAGKRIMGICRDENGILVAVPAKK